MRQKGRNCGETGTQRSGESTDGLQVPARTERIAREEAKNFHAILTEARKTKRDRYDTLEQ